MGFQDGSRVEMMFVPSTFAAPCVTKGIACKVMFHAFDLGERKVLAGFIIVVYVIA